MRGWLLLIAACGHSAGRPPAPVARSWQGSLSARVAGDDPLVATVDGNEIHASEIAELAAAEHLDARAALDELIDLDVAAAEAVRRGLADDPDVADARAREGVRRFSEDEFLARFTPAQIPDDLIAKVLSTENVKYHFDHDRYQNTVFCRVNAPKGTPSAAVRQAKANAQDIHDAIAAAQPATVADVRAACGKRAAELGLERDPSGAKGYVDSTYSTTRYASAVEEFASAAFTLKQHGDMSQPVRTPWGFDIIWLDSILPEHHTPRADAEAEVRSWPDVLTVGRQQAFEKWAAALVAQHAIERDESLLQRVSVEAPVE